MTGWVRAGGGGIPASLKNDMDSVLNKKFGTSTTYPPADWPDTVNLMGPLPEKTVSGAIANVPDGADRVPVKNWLVTLPASLDGYTEVDVVQTGKNLWNVNAITNTTNPNNATIVQNGDGSITVTTTTQQNVKSTQKFKDICPSIKVGETYYLNANTTGSQKIIYLHEAGISWTYGTSKTITAEMMESYVSFYASNVNTSAVISEISLTVGSTASAYEAYVTPTNHTVSLGRTIYGGIADVVNGTGTDENAKTTLDDTGWTYYPVSGHNTFNKVISGALAGGAGFLAGYTWEQVAYIANQSNKCFYFYTSNTGVRISIRDDDYTSLEAWQAHIDGSELVYPKTPEDFTFTPITPAPETALGVNNFYCDSGDSEVTYRADIHLALNA